MQLEMITREDLQQFKAELLNDISRLLSARSKDKPQRWLKGHEVRKLLKVSASTLQNYRINGQLHPSKIGGSFYYDYAEIESLLTKQKQQ
jgi:hypothetical protein